MRRNSKKKNNKKNVTKRQVRDMILSGQKLQPYKVLYATGRLSVDGLTMQWFTMPIPGQGVAYNQRVGDSLEIVSLRMRYTGYYGDNVNVMRLVAFQFHGVQNSAPPSVGLFLPGPTAAIDYMSPKKFLQKDQRYQCLFDKSIVVASGAMNAAVVKDFEINTPLKRINFDLNTAATIINGQVWFAVISDSGIAPHPALDYVLELRYRDI